MFCILRFEYEAKRAVDTVIYGSVVAAVSLLGWKTELTLLKSET